MPVAGVGPSGLARDARLRLQQANRVLFAFAEGMRAARSLQRTMALARMLDSELHAVCVTPAGPGLVARAMAPLAHGEGALAGSRSEREWLAEVLGDERAADALRTRTGEFVEQVAEHARELGASLIVIPPDASSGEAVTALAHAAQVPVLVAREPTLGDAIVAATDLEDCSYPVLVTAIQLSRRLGAPLVALHNLRPISVLNAVDLVLSSPTRSVRTFADLQQGRLEQAVRILPGHAVPRLADEADPVEAILREADRADVDLIAVGTRPHRWLGRLWRRRVPVRVIDRARCSVLVVPIEEGSVVGGESLAWA